MSPDDLRSARKRLGLTQHALAEALRMGKWGFQSVAKWEKGEIPVPGPVAVAVELMLERNRPTQTAAKTSSERGGKP